MTLAYPLSFNFNLPLLQSPRLAWHRGLIHAFTTRLGGVSEGAFASLNLGFRLADAREPVLENYRRLADSLALPFDRLTATQQVHRDNIVVVSDALAGHGITHPFSFEADGILTNVPHLPLLAFSADCNVLLFFDPVRRAIGAVHAGWRGTALDIGSRAIVRMREEYGTDPDDLFVSLGPAIGPCCFETHGDVPEALRALGLDLAPHVTAKAVRGETKYNIDLPAIHAKLLRRAGVRPERIDLSNRCTCCCPDLFWSHRRDGTDRGIQAGLVCLTEGGS